MADAKIGIRLAIEGADQVRGSLAGVEQGLDRLNSGLAKVGHYGTALLALPTVFNGTVGAAVKAADAVTTLNNQLRLATGSTQAAGQAYTALFDIAQRSRVSFTELGGTFAAISRAGQELGISQSRLLTVTEAIGNAMTVSGGSAQGMQAALTQLGQGLASGTLRGEELNSVMEQTPRLAKALADGLGVTTGKLREMGAAGQITAEQVIRALEGQAAVLRGEVQGAVLTVVQAFVQLENATVKAVGEFDKASGLSGTLAQAMSGLASGIDSAGNAFANNEAAIKTTLGLLAGAGVAVGLARTATALGGVATGVGGVAGAVAALKVVVSGLNPATLALLGIGAVVGAAAGYESYYKGTQEGIRKTIADLEEANAKAGESLGRMQNRPEITNAVNKAIADRAKQIQSLRAELTALDAKNAPAGSVGSGDTALARAQVAENAKLAASYEDMRVRLSGFRGDFAKYEADLKRIQAGMASGDISQKQGIAWLTELAVRHGEVAKAAKGSESEAKKAADAELAWRRRYTLDLIKGWDDEADARDKAAVAAEAYLAKIEQSLIDAAEKGAASVQAKLQSLKDEEAALVIAAAQNISLAQAIEEVEIARLREQQAALMRTGDRDAEVLAIQAEIDARKKLKDAIGSKEARDASAQTAKDAAEEWKRASQQIEQSLTDALMRGFESGKGFAMVLRDTVVNMFKTLVLRPVIQATVQGGLSAAGFGGPGAASGGTSLMGLAAMGNYSAGASTYALRAGDWLATSSNDMFAEFGTTLQANSQAIGQFTQVAGDVLGYANALNTALSRNAQGGKDYGAAAGQALGYFFGGPLGSAIGGSIGKALGLVDYGGTMHEGGAAQFSAASGLKTSNKGSDFGLAFDVDQGKYGAAIAAATAATVAGLLENAAATFGTKAGYTIATAFADDISPDGAWGALMVSLGDKVLLDWKGGQDKWPGREFANGEEGAKQYAAAVALDVRTLLIEQTPDWADAMLTALGDAPTIEALAATVGQINAAASALDSMGKASQAFAALGEDAAGALIAALGGAEAAVAGLSGYYSGFYSEAERTKLATAEVTAALAKIGVEMPTTRDAFRSVVDAAIAAGDTDLAAKLISISGAFAAVVPAAEAAATAVADTAAAMAKAAEDAAEKARRAALGQLEASAERERTLWEQQATAAASLRDEVRGVFDTLATNIRELRGEALGPELTAAQGQAFINGALASVNAGTGLPDGEGLANAIAAVRGGLSSPGMYANSMERDFAALRLAGELSVLQEAAGEQLTTAELQLQAAENQIDQLDETLAYWRKLIDGTEDGIDATKSVEEAVKALTLLMFPEDTAAGGAAGAGAGGSGFVIGGTAPGSGPARPAPAPSTLSRLGNTYYGAGGTAITDVGYVGRFDSVNSYVNTLDWSEANKGASAAALTAAANQYGVSAREISIATGMPQADVEALLPNIPRYLLGTNYVPETGLALLHKGEAVVPQVYNPAATGAPFQPMGGGDNGQVVALLQQIAARVAALEGHAATSADANAQSADVLTRVAQGNSLTTSAAPAIA